MISDGFRELGDIALSRAQALFPIPRNIVSEGNTQTNQLICDWLGGIGKLQIPSGTKVGQWTVPESWNLQSYSITGAETGIIYWSGSNDLGVVVGSRPVKSTVSKKQLLQHCHVSNDLPESVPYVTSYYSKEWGFCMPLSVLTSLQEETFNITIDVKDGAGEMELLESLIVGHSPREIVVGSYNCHPFMANNELSGVVVWMALLELCRQEQWHHSLRFYLGPETIGVIFYLNKLILEGNAPPLGALTLTCLGTECDSFTLLEDRNPGSPFTSAFRGILESENVSFKTSAFENRGSDERQWSSPTLRVLTTSLMTSKYHDYPEYHTSADNLSILSSEALAKSIELNYKFLKEIDSRRFPIYKGYGEPKLDALGLYPGVNKGGQSTPIKVRRILEFINLCDGITDYESIVEKAGLDPREASILMQRLAQGGIIEY